MNTGGIAICHYNEKFSVLEQFFQNKDHNTLFNNTEIFSNKQHYCSQLYRKMHKHKCCKRERERERERKEKEKKERKTDREN